MVRFAHIADVHLGGWKQDPLQKLNFESFVMAIDKCISEKVEFVLFAGDLFDSAYPPIEILKETFAEFRKLKEAKIPVFIIAGSHDYSVSGKTFLDVLEKAGFCKNVSKVEEVGEDLVLSPVIHEGVALFGYPGRKSGMEIPDLRRVKLNDAPGLFKIFMLHTTIDKVIGSIPMDSIKTDELPKADYYALGHIHVIFQYENFVYPGPVFPNNFKELEDLKMGSFFIVDTDSGSPLTKIELKTKEIFLLTIDIEDATTATDLIISKLKESDLEDKIVLLRVKGQIKVGKNSDIKFFDIEDYAMKKGAYFILRNTHDLNTREIDFNSSVQNTENIERDAIKSYSENNPSDFNHLIPQLIGTLNMEKQEGETQDTFTNRLMEESRKILKF